MVEIDTIRLRGRVRDAAAIGTMRHVSGQRVFDADDIGGRLDLVAGRDVLKSGARVGVDLVTGGPEAWVEFSAPKIATGSNVVALPLPDALAVARHVYDEATDLVQWQQSFDHMRVLRVDVDRDFGDVSAQPALLGALAKVRAPYDPKTRLYRDSNRGGAATLTRGPASRWEATLYDKQGESLHRLRHARSDEDKEQARRDVVAAEGRLRYEARLRPDAMKHLRLVQDMNTTDLGEIARGYFDRVGYGLEVTGMARACEVVMAAEEMRLDSRMALLGWLLCTAQGMPPEMHRNSDRKYRERAREVGVTAADLLDVATKNVRLDYDTARMVEVA